MPLCTRPVLVEYPAAPPLPHGRAGRRLAVTGKTWRASANTCARGQRRLSAIAHVRHLKGELQQRPSQGSLGGDSHHSRPAVACRLTRAVCQSCAGAARAFEAAKRRRKSASSAPKRPPPSTARTTSRQRRDASSSGRVVWRLRRPASAAALPGTRSAPRGPLCGASPPAARQRSCHARGHLKPLGPCLPDKYGPRLVPEARPAGPEHPPQGRQPGAPPPPALAFCQRREMLCVVRGDTKVVSTAVSENGFERAPGQGAAGK